MTLVALGTHWIVLILVGLAAFIALMDVLVAWSRRNQIAAFPGGTRRLAWAIAIAAVGKLAIFLVTTFAPTTLLYAVGAALGLPEIAGYAILFAGILAGTLLAGQVERAVVRELNSALLNDREQFLHAAPPVSSGASR